MNIIYFISFVSILTTISFIGGPLTISTVVNAQTPTTSDLPATIGNESTTDMGLTNNTLPAENATTVTPVSPM